MERALLPAGQSHTNFSQRARVKTRSRTCITALSEDVSVSVSPTRLSSRDCMNVSRLKAASDALFGDGVRECSIVVLGAASRSLSLLPFRSFLLCLWRSMTISILS